MRVLVAPLLEPDQLELLGDHLVALGLGHAAQLEAEADILGDRAPGQQRELLEHHGDAVGAQTLQRRRIAAGDVDRAALVGNQHLAAGRLVEPVDAAQQRRLARAGQAHEHADLAFLDADRGVGHADHVAGLLEDRRAFLAPVQKIQRGPRMRAEDDVDVAEIDLRHAFSSRHLMRPAACTRDPA